MAVSSQLNQVAMYHLAWAVSKSCSAPPPKKAHEGDYWTRHAKHFIDIREREMRPATAVANKEHIHRVAAGISKEIKAAAFEDGNATALKVTCLISFPLSSVIASISCPTVLLIM